MDSRKYLVASSATCAAAGAVVFVLLWKYRSLSDGWHSTVITMSMLALQVGLTVGVAASVLRCRPGRFVGALASILFLIAVLPPVFLSGSIMGWAVLTTLTPVLLIVSLVLLFFSSRRRSKKAAGDSARVEKTEDGGEDA